MGRDEKDKKRIVLMHLQRVLKGLSGKRGASFYSGKHGWAVGFISVTYEMESIVVFGVEGYNIDKQYTLPDGHVPLREIMALHI
ncbi:MAG: hypothetical protein HDQ98_15755 [Lachnospiraceae bacterium]|nr:hypothetical protein [Lachnospiraceae bacterium]